MYVFQGNTTGSIKSSALNIPSTIKSFSLVNKTGGAITVTVYVSPADGSDIAIIPLSLSLSAGEGYVSDVPRRVYKDYYILIIASGSCDYYFTID